MIGSSQIYIPVSYGSSFSGIHYHGQTLEHLFADVATCVGLPKTAPFCMAFESRQNISERLDTDLQWKNFYERFLMDGGHVPTIIVQTPLLRPPVVAAARPQQPRPALPPASLILPAKTVEADPDDAVLGAHSLLMALTQSSPTVQDPPSPFSPSSTNPPSSLPSPIHADESLPGFPMSNFDAARFVLETYGPMRIPEIARIIADQNLTGRPISFPQYHSVLWGSINRSIKTTGRASAFIKTKEGYYALRDLHIDPARPDTVVLDNGTELRVVEAETAAAPSSGRRRGSSPEEGEEDFEQDSAASERRGSAAAGEVRSLSAGSDSESDGAFSPGSRESESVGSKRRRSLRLKKDEDQDDFSSKRRKDTKKAKPASPHRQPPKIEFTTVPQHFKHIEVLFYVLKELGPSSISEIVDYIIEHRLPTSNAGQTLSNSLHSVASRYITTWGDRSELLRAPPGHYALREHVQEGGVVKLKSGKVLAVTTAGRSRKDQ